MGPGGGSGVAMADRAGPARFLFPLSPVPESGFTAGGARPAQESRADSGRFMLRLGGKWADIREVCEIRTAP